MRFLSALLLALSQVSGRGVSDKVLRISKNHRGSDDPLELQNKLSKAELLWGKEYVKNIYIAAETVKVIYEALIYPGY